MKTLVFFLLLSFVWRLSDARGAIASEDLIPCLIENGFTNSTSDVDLIYAIGDPKQADKLKDVSKEKMADVIACLYYKLYAYKKLHFALRQLIDRDDTLTKMQIRQMAEKTSDYCYKKDGGKIRNADLLNCVNITEPPFDHLFAAIRDVRQALQWCFIRCKVTISEMYTIERNREKPLKEFMKYVPNERLGCLMACQAQQDTADNPGFTLQNRLADLIKRSKNVDENEKEKMLKSLNECHKQVYGIEDEPYDLVKCLDLFKPPFIEIFESYAKDFS